MGYLTRNAFKLTVLAAATDVLVYLLREFGLGFVLAIMDMTIANTEKLTTIMSVIGLAALMFWWLAFAAIVALLLELRRSRSVPSLSDTPER